MDYGCTYPFGKLFMKRTLMSSDCVNNEITKQLRLVRHFILVVYREQHESCVQIHVHLLTKGITSEMYIMEYVDKNTLHLPFKIKATGENKIRFMQMHAYSLKPKSNQNLVLL